MTQYDDTLTQAGDIGRRAMRRRMELGLTREEVAQRSGMAPGYVAYLEEHLPLLTRGSLTRLARALRTSPEVLLGTGTEAPPGRWATVQPDTTMVPMPCGECMDLITPGGVGRVAFTVRDDAAPTVLPVNYVVTADTIVFRTSEHGVIAEHARGVVTFEVDAVDEAVSEGWSVLVTGPARRLRDERELATIRALTPVRPWAGGQRDTYIRILPIVVRGRRITGRRLVGAPEERPTAPSEGTCAPEPRPAQS